MAEYDRSSEVRNSAAWNREEPRRWRDEGRERSAFYGDRSNSYGDDRLGQSGDLGERSSFRTTGYGLEAYGVPADYGYRGPEMRPVQGGRRPQGAVGRPSFGDGMDGYAFTGASEPTRYGRDGGTEPYGGPGRHWGAEWDDRYALNDSRRGSEERGWWAQTRDEVSSWFGDDAAARRRQNDDLRAGDHRGRGPKGYVRSDERIKDDVNDRLTDSPWLDASDVEVAVSGAEVTLNGAVQRREDKRHAEDIAERVSGVKHVQNNIRIKEQAASAKTSYSSGSVGSASAPTGVTGQIKTN